MGLNMSEQNRKPKHDVLDKLGTWVPLRALAVGPQWRTHENLRIFDLTDKEWEASGGGRVPIRLGWVRIW